MAQVLSDVAHRFDSGQSLYIQGVSYLIASSTLTPHRQVILKFHGIESAEAAQGLVGQELTVPEAAVTTLPEGEYFHYQLLGLRVITEEGEELWPEAAEGSLPGLQFGLFNAGIVVQAIGLTLILLDDASGETYAPVAAAGSALLILGMALFGFLVYRNTRDA